MARKQLINLHSTVVKNPSTSDIQPSIAVGEIVVQAVKSAPVIYTKVYDSTKQGDDAYSFAEFIDKAEVETLISTAVSGVSSDVTELSEKVGALSGETKTLESHFEAAVSGIGYTANSIANYIDAQQFAKDSDLQSVSSKTVYAFSGLTIDKDHSVKTYVDDEVKSERDARVSADSGLTAAIGDVATDLANATSGIGVSQNSIKNYIENQHFAKDNDLQTLSGTVNTLNTNFTNVTSGFSGQNAIKNAIDNEADARRDKDTELENSITGLSTDFNNAVSGIGKAQGSIKSYVDGQVSQAISSVYRVQGSVATYEDLPTTGLTVGDVYNVVAEATVGGKWYPAGTNWVYTEQGWDPLGGTFDLTPYALDADLQEEISARTSADAEINGKIGGSFDSTNTVAAAITSARTSADNSLKSITGTGSDYLTVTIDAVTGVDGAKSQKFSAVPVVAADLDLVESGETKLADAYDVKTKIAAINTDITTLSQAFSAESAYTYNEIAKVLTGISAEGKNVYVEASATTKTDKTQTVEVKAIVAGPLSSMTASSGQLADAYFVKNYIDKEISDEATARAAVATNLANLTKDFTAETAFTSSELAKVLTAITAEGKNSYVSASATTKTDKVQGVEVTANVAGDLSGVSATGQLADAKRVKDYVDAGVSSAWTKANSVDSALTDLKNIVGNNSGYTSTHTITDALASLEADAVRSVSVKNGGSGAGKNGITATEDADHNVEFDFDNMIVDCGEY